MRVLIVTRSVPEHAGAGGMERVAWDLASAMAADADVTILTTPVPGRPARWTQDGIDVETLPGLRPGRYSVGWWVKTARFRAARDFDTIMSVSAGATAMLHAQRGPTYVFQAHGTALRELQNALRVRTGKWPLKALRYGYWTGIDAITYRRADAVVAVSETVAASLRARPYRGAWVGTELRVVPNTVNAEHFAPDPARRKRQRAALGIPAEFPVIACVSRLDRQKGIDRAIAALGTLAPYFHLVVAGEGPEADRLVRATARHGVYPRVHFMGRVDYDGVRDVLQAADVFVFPVRNPEREGMPMAVLEALAAGLAVVVPIGSTWPDDVADKVTFADMDDPRALGSAIREALYYR